MRILFKGGSVYQEGEICHADVLLEDGFIVDIGQDIARKEGIKTVDSRGCLLSPSFCDLHVHLRQPGFEAKETIETGTRAGAAGGYTTLCAMPNLSPIPDNAEALEKQLKIIQTDALIEVLPYASISRGQKGEQLADISRMAPSVAGFSDDGRGVQSEQLMREAMQQVAESGGFIAAHCEVEAVLPQDGVCVQQGSALAEQNGWQGVSNQSEWLEVERNIALAKETGCRLHICHASTSKTFDLVRKAQSEGLAVSCEVTPHNLLLSCEDIFVDNGRFKMNPPLRGKEDTRAALAALIDGTATAVATDHAPHTHHEKSGGFAKSMNGVVGLETAFAVLYTKHVLQNNLSLETLVERMADGPRKILGRSIPAIAKGEKANFVLIDLENQQVVRPEEFITKGRATPFEGWQLKGWPLLTMHNGGLAWQKYEII